MADDDKAKPATKEYQLLADGMLIEGTEYAKGDKVLLDPKHGERLQKDFGAVAPPGTLERRAKAEEEAKAAHARAEAEIAEKADNVRRVAAGDDTHDTRTADGGGEQAPVKRPGR